MQWRLWVAYCQLGHTLRFDVIWEHEYSAHSCLWSTLLRILHVLCVGSKGHAVHCWLPMLQDFGAVGDGVADDTQAFLGAVDAIGRQGTIFVPQGRYIITQQINIPNRVVIRGKNSAYQSRRCGALLHGSCIVC